MKKQKYIIKSTNLFINPDNPNDLYNEKWSIYQKSDDSKIGWFSFEGEKISGTIPIQIELDPLFRNRGIGTEALKEIVDWAFLHKNIYEITAISDHENDSYIYALEKAGFVYRKKENEKEVYSIIKPHSSWLGLYVVIGIIIGLILAAILNNPWVGFLIGLIPCILTGTKMDMDAIKDRERTTGHKVTKNKIKIFRSR